MRELSPADASPSPEEVRAQLERILCSQALNGSDQLKRLLRLVVERTLNGQPELLKEYNLGLEVFLRPPNYDPKVDPIVRVQARRLRSKLDEYYASEGAHDTLVIQIPKGAYVPLFEARNSAERALNMRPAPDKPWRRWGVWLVGVAALLIALVLTWVANDRVAPRADIDHGVAVLPLKMFTEGGSQGHIANQITEVLTTELAMNKQLRVLSRTTASKYRETTLSLPEIARTLGVRWVVEGGIGMEGNRAYVKLRAVDSLTDRKIWADVIDFDLSDRVEASVRAADSITAAIVAEVQSPRP